MTQRSEFDLAVIGGGPGGYVAALRGAQLGLKVVLVEKKHLGGICLNWGCIPTKALLHVADTLRHIRDAGALGLKLTQPEVDLERVVARSRQVAQRLNRGVAHLLKKASVVVVDGTGSVAGNGVVEVRGGDGSDRLINATNVILATGARPRPLPDFPFDGDRIWSYYDALTPATLPKSLIVIGSGAIGMEFASFYSTLGTQVTVVEAKPQVLPASDEAVSMAMRKAFEGQGMRVLTGVMVESVEKLKSGVRVQISNAGVGEMLEAEHVLVAIGLTGNVDGIGIEHTKIRVEHGCIVTNANGATDEPGVWAIGDVVGAPMLAHKASHQAVACAERIAGVRDEATHDAAWIPACTYSYPQTASVGMSESQAQATGVPLKIGTFPLEGNGRAVAIGEASGFVKTIFDAQTGALLGAHMVGPEVAELIHGFTLAGALEATEAEIMDTVFPHPSVSEAMHESVLAAFGRALHI
jgi:dihydrolipoamide dehydrogenase